MSPWKIRDVNTWTICGISPIFSFFCFNSRLNSSFDEFGTGIESILGELYLKFTHKSILNKISTNFLFILHKYNVKEASGGGYCFAGESRGFIRVLGFLSLFGNELASFDSFLTLSPWWDSEHLNTVYNMSLVHLWIYIVST